MATVWFSLRQRLLMLLLGGVTLGWLVTMIFSYNDIHHEVDDVFDAQLIQAAQTLLALASRDSDNDVDELDDLNDVGTNLHQLRRRTHFQIWQGDGELMLHSNNTPETPIATVDGFSDRADPRGKPWRVFSVYDKDKNLRVQVSESHKARHFLVRQMSRQLLFPALLGLPLIGLWVWLAIQRGFSPLQNIARQIASRDPQQLQAIEPASAPEEIRTLLDALNRLFGKVDSALQAERRFTADAAHELRTPLAALQAQLQVARRARDEAERELSLEKLQHGLSRASHLVDQMLQLARLDPESGLPNPSRVDLSTLAEWVCAELGSSILEKNIDFELKALPNTRIVGQAEWLQVLMRNLVDNAIRYTPEGGSVRVTVTQSGKRCFFIVRDDGPGIPPEEREQVTHRFHRLNPAETAGSGLGLAIVTRIANLHGTELLLEDGQPQRGLQASVEFVAANA